MTLSIEKYEIWQFSKGLPKFLHTDVYLSSPDEVRHTSLKKREPDIQEQDINFSLAGVIPTDDLWPLPSESLTLFEGEIGPHHYIKGPNLGNYSMLQSASENPADLLLHEAKIYETHLKGTHPNIARYFGYIQGPDGRLRGLCLEKYVETLAERVEDPGRPLNIDQCLQEVRAGLDFMHEQGLAHNDVNVFNVMLDKNDTVHLIDFDSCRCVGDSLGAKPGVDPTRTVSAYENDHKDFESLQTWLTSSASCP